MADLAMSNILQDLMEVFELLLEFLGAILESLG
jgi:hypothetical protein